MARLRKVWDNGMDMALVLSCFHLSLNPSHSVRETELFRMLSKNLKTLRGPVVVKVSITGVKHQEQKQFGEEMVFFRLQHSAHSLSWREVRAGTGGIRTWRQTWKPKP